MSDSPIFSRLFGRSPIAPLQEHMKLARDCAMLLPGFIDAVIDGDSARANSINDEIIALENQADDVKRELRIGLPRSLFLPIPRGDLLELLRMQDRIPNRSKDIGGIIVAREMQFPAELQDHLTEFVARSVEASRLACEVLNELDELIVSGFSGKEVELVENMLERISEAEHETDVKQVELERALLAIEKELNPVDVMFMYRVFDWIGELADDSQAVGNRMLYVIAR